jgi:hypothetical protein
VGWNGLEDMPGRVESSGQSRRAERLFSLSKHTWSGRAGAYPRFDFPPIESGAIKDNLFGKLLSGESFDDRHGTSAVRTGPSRFAGFRYNRRGDLGGGEQSAAQRQRHCALAMGEKTETTDAHES